MAGTALLKQLVEALAFNEQLRSDNEQLRAESKALRGRVALLGAEMGRSSESSSRPPAGDPIGPRQSRAERRASARKAGGRQGKQPGAPGAHLEAKEPDVVVEHAPVSCRCCGKDLAGAEVVGEVRRQVIDIPPVRPVVTDHVA